MGFFGFRKKEKTDVERYYEQRQTQGSPYISQTQENMYAAHQTGSFGITVEDVFTITGRGTVIVGKIERGSVTVGDEVRLCRMDGSVRNVTITGIEMFRKIIDTAHEGDNVGLLLRGVGRADVAKGDRLEK